MAGCTENMVDVSKENYGLCNRNKSNNSVDKKSYNDIIDCIWYNSTAWIEDYLNNEEDILADLNKSVVTIHD